jgi:ankyrin repeat protein
MRKDTNANAGPEVVRAIESDDADQLKELLKTGLSLGAVIPLDPKGKIAYTLLEYAVQKGAREITALLIKAGAQLNEGKFKPLIIAVLTNSLEMVKLLLDAGADPNVKRNDEVEKDRGSTALMSAVSPPRGPELLELLLARGADSNLVTSKGNTALSKAVAYGNAQAAKRLLQAGCKADGTLLLRPIYSGDIGLLRAFIAAGADVNVTGIWSQLKGKGHWEDAPANCTLLDAAVSERADKVKLLRNLLPAERARFEERFKSQADLYFTMVQELVQAGADVNNIVASVSPLYWAADSGDFETVRLLLQAGADPNLARNLPRNMPLHQVCRGGFVEIAECLLKAGADVKMTNEEGRTALEELRQKTKSYEIEIWEKAIQQGTKVDSKLMDAKYEAWNKNRARLIKILESAGV